MYLEFSDEVIYELRSCFSFWTVTFSFFFFYFLAKLTISFSILNEEICLDRKINVIKSQLTNAIHLKKNYLASKN